MIEKNIDLKHINVSDFIKFEENQKLFLNQFQIILKERLDKIFENNVLNKDTDPSKKKLVYK